MMFVCVKLGYVHFFFFKQKTAYEMRISDWSSDVCSSDLQSLTPYVGLCLIEAAPWEQLTRLFDASRCSALALVRNNLDFISGIFKRRTIGNIEHPVVWVAVIRTPNLDRQSTRLNPSHYCAARIPASACDKKNIISYTFSFYTTA